jgi:hypothetical protein
VGPGTLRDISLRSPPVRHSFVFLADDAVLGTTWGRLARDLAVRSGARVVIDSDDPAAGIAVIAAGRGVDAVPADSACPLFLIAPSRPGMDHKWNVPPAVVFLPEIDEDGRSAWWRERLGDSPTRLVTLAGVGVRVDWAWDDVVTALNEAKDGL